MSRGVRRLPIGGWTPFTTIDYPGQLAAVVFCQGCPWHCPYCHNADLREFGRGRLLWEEIREKIEKRRGWIEAVVFSGGEPTAHDALPLVMNEVKAMGFKVGLHTAGIYPRALQQVLPLTDWVGLDIKAPLGAKYTELTGLRNSTGRIFESLIHLRASRKPYQLRTTFDSALLTEADLAEINRFLSKLGMSPTVLQPVRTLEEIERQVA